MALKSASLFASCIECPVREKNPLRDLPDEILKEFSSCKTANLYKKGQIIFYEGNRPFGVYCVNSGKVKLTKYAPDGKTYIVRVVQGGDLLGYRSFFTNEEYNATAEVLEDASVCFLDKALFLNALKKYPHFALNILERMGGDLKCAEEKSRDLAYKSVQERLIELLLTLKESYGEEQADGSYKLNILLTREELASMLGTTTETTVRNLTWLKEKDLLYFERKYLILKDIKQLVDLLPLY